MPDRCAFRLTSGESYTVPPLSLACLIELNKAGIPIRPKTAVQDFARACEDFATLGGVLFGLCEPVSGERLDEARFFGGLDSTTMSTATDAVAVRLAAMDGPRGTASYEATEVDPFGRTARERDAASRPAPEWLIDKLVGLGVARETAEGYGHRQAHGVLRSMQAKQINDRKSRSGGSNGFDPNGPANDNQRRFLERHGRNPNVPYCEAARLIALIQMG